MTDDDLRGKKLELAARLYDLDEKVFLSIGSSISRSYTGSREHTIQVLADLMGHEDRRYILRSELAMVANMARTITDRETRSGLMREYDSILQQIEALPDTFGSVDIIDEERARLNLANIKQRFGANDRLIICISRTLGCAGTDIGFALADTLKINFYDTEIFSAVLDRLDATTDEVHDHYNTIPSLRSERPRRTIKQWFADFKRYHGLPKEDAMFFNQSDLICEMARQEDFVVMGRCADVILKNEHIPHISIFINAPIVQRLQHVAETRHVSSRKALKIIRAIDDQRRDYYRFYTGLTWGHPANYDLCLNSASYGIDGSVELICRMLDRHLPNYMRKRPENER